MTTVEDIERVAWRVGLASRAKLLRQTARAAIVATPSATDLSGIPLGASRLGGVPDLPADVEWPTWQGRPLAFIAQFRMADMAGLTASQELPSSGWLWFFYDAEQNTWGFDPKDADSFKVMYRSEGNLHRQDLPEALPMEGQFQACSLSFDEQWCLPPGESVAFELLGFSEDEQERYTDMNEPIHGEEWADRSMLLGYPDQIQGDLQRECALVTGGVYCGDTEAPNHPRYSELMADAPSWRLLLQVASEDEAGMMWGDVGCLYYYMRDADLRAANFDKCWMILQCG